ncbi:MAG: hypothetical protein ACRDSS_00010 [Actinocrinis sp.]
MIGYEAELAQEVLSAFGRGEELPHFLSRTGNSFIAMSEALLDGWAAASAGLDTAPGFDAAPGFHAASELEAAPGFDTVLLAYRTPDLYYSEVAGCYLSDRLPGAPVPCSVAEQGPGAPFTALRIADAMWRLGELERGALFAYDQNGAAWDADEARQSRPDAAALIELGGAPVAGAARIAELTETRAGDTGFPDPARVLEDTAARHPGVRTLIGAELAAQLDMSGSDDLWGTALWAALARLWPIREPVLLADFHGVGGVFYSCLLVPDAEA